MAEYIECEASCEDCSHYPVCEDKLFGSNHKNCRHFKNKADVVEVVRCKDCRYYKRTSIGGCMACVKQTAYRKPNDYCSQGEKMDGKGDGDV